MKGLIHLKRVISPTDSERLRDWLREEPGERTTPYNERGDRREAAPGFVNSYTSFGTPWARELVTGAIDCQRETIERRFDRELELNPELHFLSYPTGGFIRGHKDVIPETTALEKIRERLVVFSLFLNDDYDGGQFMVKAGGFPFPPKIIKAGPGDMVAFVSHLTHGVSTITAGTRHSVTGWFRAPDAGE